MRVDSDLEGEHDAERVGACPHDTIILVGRVIEVKKATHGSLIAYPLGHKSISSQVTSSEIASLNL